MWERITVTWGNESRWTFTPATDGKTYVLRQIDDLLLDWDDSRRIRSVRSAHTPNSLLLVFAYDPATGMLSSVTDGGKRTVVYLYETPPPSAGLGNTPGLRGVSVIHFVGEKQPEIFYRQTYGYTAVAGTAVLATIDVPGDKGYSSASILYRGRQVAGLVDGNENRHVYTYVPTGTRVDVWGKASGRIDGTWTENIHTFSRHTGTTDALGHSTVIRYGNGR